MPESEGMETKPSLADTLKHVVTPVTDPSLPEVKEDEQSPDDAL